jgi:long-chain fatty acid transport protein
MKHTVILAAALISTPTTANAGGMFVPGIGPTAQARAGAFVARADDPTALAHNPAGFGKLDGTIIYAGSNFVRLNLDFTRFGFYEATGELEPYEGQPYPTVSSKPSPSPGFRGFQGLPIAVVSTDFGKPELPIRAAIGFYTPHGNAARDFPDTVRLPDGTIAPGPQRYDVAVQKGKAATPSIAVAYSPLDDLHVGARLSWGFSSLKTTKIVWAIDNYDEYVEKDSVTKAQASDNFIPSAGVGFLYKVPPNIEIGGAYNTAQHIRANGTLSSVTGDAVPEGNELQPDNDFWRCRPGGVEGALKVCISLNLPQTGSLGGRYIFLDRKGEERADVELDLKWEDWSEASTTITQSDAISAARGPLNEMHLGHGFKDVLSTRLGGSYTLPVGANKIIFRAGAAYDTATAPVSWTRLDTDGKERTTLATGIGFEAEKWRIDAGGGVVLEPVRDVRHDCQEPGGPTRESPNCDGVSEDYTPVTERDAPSPAQPLNGAFNQLESPFNAGRYESGYYLLHIGFAAWF